MKKVMRQISELAYYALAISTSIYLPGELPILSSAKKC